MHIPDGYLSPSTCAALYGASTPFWYAASRRVKALVHTRLAPFLSVFAAFSFVVMMFNLPIPGGTTAHPLGIGIATIVLGPWGAILSVSVALFIQAVFFGDGGITTLGANCFNMAIVGSLVAYLIYRVVAGRTAISSPRRVVGAALAGYAAINAAALCAAVELGIQPLLFKDVSGTPLYAPYSLNIAVPAIMVAHVTLAGLAELIVSGGVVAYLQKTNPALLKQTAPGIPAGCDEGPGGVQQGGWKAARPLWVATSLLLVLTPLGILTAGSAWGEWSLRDFSNPAARHQIAAVSGNVAPPAQAPRGLQHLSSVWTAPFPNYAPSFVRSPAFGYLLSAMFGAGIIILVFLIAGQLTAGKLREEEITARTEEDSGRPRTARQRRRRSFIERTLAGFTDTLEHALYADDLARAKGLLQRLDPRIKVPGILALIATAAIAHRLWVIGALFATAIVIAVLSRVSLRVLMKRVWIAVLLFTGVIVLPVLFLTPGELLGHLPVLGWPITAQGLTTAAYLVARVETAATLSTLLILCTPWGHVLKALRVLKVPVLLVAIIGMTYRYIFLLLQTAHNMFESRQSRMVGELDGPERRHVAAASVGVLMSKTVQLSSDVHMAMQSRGFQGEVYVLDDFQTKPFDWLMLAIFALLAGGFLWLGR